MSMIKCSECGKEISDTVKTCINCGAKVKHKKRKYTEVIIGTIILLIFIIGLGTYYITTNYSRVAHKYSKEAISVLRDYKDNKISDKKVISELESLSYKANKESKEKEEDIKLYSISVNLNSIATNIKSKTLDRLDIEEYIKKLKEF